MSFSQKLEKAGLGASYVYYFKRDLPGDNEGAFHSAELWYMFGTLDRCWRPMTEGDHALSDAMLDLWTDFAKTGNPNSDGREPWRPCTGDDAFVMEFDV